MICSGKAEIERLYGDCWKNNVMEFEGKAGRRRAGGDD